MLNLQSHNMLLRNVQIKQKQGLKTMTYIFSYISFNPLVELLSIREQTYQDTQYTSHKPQKRSNQLPLTRQQGDHNASLIKSVLRKHENQQQQIAVENE